MECIDCMLTLCKLHTNHIALLDNLRKACGFQHFIKESNGVVAGIAIFEMLCLGYVFTTYVKLNTLIFIHL